MQFKARLATSSLILLAFAQVSLGQARTATVRGFVTDASNGQPLPGASVALVDDLDRTFGTATQDDGVYLVPRLAPGRYVLQVSFIGYATQRDTLQLAPREVLEMDFALEPTAKSLDGVVVEGEQLGGAASVEGGLQVVRAADIEVVPSPDVSGDLALFLQALPGIVTVGDQGGQVFVRGGEPSQNMVLIDGILLYQPFHILGFYSAFPSDIILNADVYAGGFGARYGGRISSVIDITTRNGNTVQYSGQASASPFIVGGVLEGPLSSTGKLSFLASFRQSVVENGAAQLVDREIPFVFNDVFAKLYGIPRKNGRVSFSGIRTYDRGTIGEDIGLTPLAEVRWINEGVGGRYLYLPGALPVLGDFRVSGSRLKTELGPEGSPIRTSTVGRIDLSADVTHFATFGSFKWGGFSRTMRLESELGGTFQDLFLDREFVTEAGMYAGPEWEMDNGVVVAPSLRVHSFPSKNRVFVEPRVRAKWARERDQLSGAFGIYHQEVVGINDRRDATSVFTAWAASPFRVVPRAIHAVLGYQVRPTRQLEFAVEGYYKNLANLSIAEWTAFPRLTTRIQLADGRVWGMDARIEFRSQRFYGYVNYGLSSVRYDAKQPSLELWFGTETFRFRPPHDRRHQINMVGTTNVAGFDVNVRWQFGSGLPFNRALGFDGFLLLDRDINVFEDEGDRRVIYERPFNGLLPTYHRLDASVDRVFRIGLADVTVQGSVINAYNRANIFYLDVFTLRRADQFPFLPSLGIKVELNR